jgi:transposase
MDKVRRSEYARLKGEDQKFIKGRRYTLLSHWENLSMDGKKALRTPLKANKRLQRAYLLKESFGQLWNYRKEGWTRKLFKNWCASLKVQKLESFEKFAKMIDRHWDGIAAYCLPENKASLGFVEARVSTTRSV